MLFDSEKDEVWIIAQEAMESRMSEIYKQFCDFVSETVTSVINQRYYLDYLYNRKTLMKKWLHTIFRKISETKDGISWEKYEKISKERYDGNGILTHK